MTSQRIISVFASLWLISACAESERPVPTAQKQVKPVETVAKPAEAVPASETKTAVQSTPNTAAEISKKKSLDAKTSPTEVIKLYTEELRGIAEIKEPNEKGKANKKRENTIAEKVRQFFDFEELARQSLGINWKSQSPSDRRQFSKLFITLVENSYLSRSRSLVADYDVSYLGEKIDGQKANVTSRVARRDANVDIVYDLHKKNDHWMIYNITLDNVNLIRNYQSQFNQIIKKKGFKHLINTMQARLKEPQEEVPL